MPENDETSGPNPPHSEDGETLSAAPEVDPVEEGEYDDLILWMLSLTPTERLEVVQRAMVGQADCCSREGAAAFLKRVDVLKQRYDGGVSDFEPARLDFEPADPFP